MKQKIEKNSVQEENHDARSRRQSVIFEEPPSGGFSRAIWLEDANQ